MVSDSRSIGRYRIESTLGHGGMGVVYLAEDTVLRRRVALKLLSPDMARDSDARRRLTNEARAAATLSHPNTATLYEIGSEGDLLFLSMEFVPGRTLRDLIEDGPIPWAEALHIALDVLAALKEAHEKGIVHRDIKGANVKRTPDGRVKVLDFGLATVASGTTVTTEAALVGTVAYMSPQQVCGEVLDGRSDLYSLGVLLYELLTGQLPFQGDQHVAVAHAILHQDPITIRELAPDVPEELEHIVFKAMMKSVASRYQSAAEMAEDLVRFQEHDRRRRAGIHEEVDLKATQEVYEARKERFQAPLVGRETVLDRLGRRLSEIRATDGAALVIAGEAGVGKTRLVDEFRHATQRDGVRFLKTSCLYGGGAGSYFPFSEILRQYFDLRGVQSAAALQAFFMDRAPRLVGSLPVLSRFLRFTFVSNGPTSEEELWEVIDQVVAFIAEERPLALVVEDLQWADESSLRLLHFLARRLPGRRLLLVGTYRPEDVVADSGGRPHALALLLPLLGRSERFERIELGRLSHHDVETIVDRLYPRHEWTVEFPRLLYRESEGNPFFLVEILKLLSSEGILVEEAGVHRLRTAVDRISIPERVVDVVMQRVNRLQRGERDILELGAVEGDVFHSGTILSGLRIERMALLKTLQFLEQVHHLIHASGPRYHFDHPKIREILYESIPSELRVEYHTVVGHYLRESFGESDEHAGIIAHNLVAAGLKTDALPYLLRAGQAAGRLFAHRDAIHYFSQAEQVLHEIDPAAAERDPLSTLVEIRWRRGEEEYACGRYDDALVSYERALQHDRTGGRPRREADLLRAIARTHYLLGRAAESRRAYDEAQARFEAMEAEARATGNDASLALAARELGKICFFRGELEDARRYIEEAAEIAGRLGEERLRASALNNLAGVFYVRGDFARAMACHRDALAIREVAGDQLGMAQSHKNIGIVHYRQGELTEAERHLDEALRGYRRAGDRRGEAVTLRHMGNAHFEAGDHAAAQRHWEVSIALSRELGNREDQSRCLNNLGLLHFEQGHYASAQRLFQEALDSSAELDAKDLLVIIHLNLAALYLDLDRIDRASEELIRADELARALGSDPFRSEVHALQARLAAEMGDQARARQEANRSLAHVEPTGHTECMVLGLLAAAEAAVVAQTPAEASRLALQARDLARWSRMTHFELRATLDAARASLRAGDAGGAIELIEEAVPRTEEAGYHPLAVRGNDLAGLIRAAQGDPAGAAESFRRAAAHMLTITEALNDEDRRSFLHHPDWKAVIGHLLDTLLRLGLRDEALGYLGRLGLQVRDVPRSEIEVTPEVGA